jgi:hypothetical protein
MRARSSVTILCALLVGCGGKATYPRECADPLRGWRKPSDGYSVLAIANHVRLTRNGKILWNGEQISPQKLSDYSSSLPQMNPIPFTILQIDDGANCSVVREVRRTINERAKCMEWGTSRCGEGPEPWALVGDVIGPNGETYKFYPDRNRRQRDAP